MTHTFLLEIGLEEMPAQIVQPSEMQLADKVKAFLTEEKLTFETLRSFSTPRRLAVQIEGLSTRQPDETQTVKGPAKRIAIDDEGNWTKAAIGFSKGQGASPDDIVFKEVKGEEYVFVEKHIEGKETSEVLQGLKEVIASLTFPVSMKWGNTSYKYIRPIHWLVSLLDEEIVDLKVFDVESGRQTRGHRFLGKEVELADAKEYISSLEKEWVTADREARKELISKQIQTILEENQWTLSESGDLLDEVTDLVEYPTAFSASFNKDFLNVPEAALETSMIDHQRYFPVRDAKTGKLVANFIGVRNGNEDYIEEVAQGNEKVLSARLADADFFYEEDKKKSIDSYVEQLKSVQFHEKLGTLYDKQERVKKIASVVAGYWKLNEEEKGQLERAASIYKFDLVTNMVVEFTKLQGIIGEMYALERGEDPVVAKAIRQSYEPKSTEKPAPSDRVGACLSLAEKLDTLLHFFAIGLIPSGSNDPFALRRQAAGIVRLIESHEQLISWESFLEQIIEVLNPSEEMRQGMQEQSGSVIQFLKDRVDNQLQDQEYSISHDIRQAALTSKQDDVYLMIDAATTLHKAKDSEEYKTVVESLTRVANLATKLEKVASIDENLFETESEKELLKRTVEAEGVFDYDTEGWKRYRALKDLSPAIEAFFEENMVMADDKAVKTNRLALLKKINELSERFANLSELVIK